MSTFQERLQQEQQELTQKVEKLSIFLETADHNDNVSALQLDLLHAQLHAMAAYLSILHTRMRDLQIPLLDN